MVVSFGCCHCHDRHRRLCESQASADREPESCLEEETGSGDVLSDLIVIVSTRSVVLVVLFLHSDNEMRVAFAVQWPA